MYRQQLVLVVALVVEEKQLEVLYRPMDTEVVLLEVQLVLDELLKVFMIYYV